MAASLFERQLADKALQESNELLEARVEERTRELSELALQDTLTGLPNRRWMLEHLKYALGRVKHDPSYQFGLLFIDLDRFKIINDSLGHVAGDELLVNVAKRLKRTVREGDAVARLGGDEFTVFVNEFDPVGLSVMHVAERIEQVLEEPMRLEDRTVYISGSIGVALSATGYSAPEDMLRDADTAMYRAKQAGGTARIQVFDPGMHQTAFARLEMENDLRHAIQENQFSLVYQPIFEFNSSRLAGFESLIRWNHPSKGMISPLDFIPVAEDMRLIAPIGNWVLRRSCETLAVWRDQFPKAKDLVISVNVSPVQLRVPEFDVGVKRLLTTTGVPGNRLKLELTESILVQNTNEITMSLAKLQELGIEVMIDDFGTGFSSLSYLAHLPVDSLKIDKSFISGGRESAESAEVVRCIVAMAKALRIGTVAEGVETASQAEWLRELGCDLAQGYLYSKPLNAEDATAMVRDFAETIDSNRDINKDVSEGD